MHNAFLSLFVEVYSLLLLGIFSTRHCGAKVDYEHSVNVDELALISSGVAIDWLRYLPQLWLTRFCRFLQTFSFLSALKKIMTCYDVFDNFFLIEFPL